MINSWTIGNRLPFFIEIKMKLRAILEGRWYTGRNAHQIWAEWAVWARWQILNGSQFFSHFNEKWLSVDNISWIYYQICLDKDFLLIHLQDCCAAELTVLPRSVKQNSSVQLYQTLLKLRSRPDGGSIGVRWWRRISKQQKVF